MGMALSPGYLYPLYTLHYCISLLLQDSFIDVIIQYHLQLLCKGLNSLVIYLTSKHYIV